MGLLDFFTAKNETRELRAKIESQKKALTVMEVVNQMFSSNNGSPVIRNDSDALNTYRGELPWVSVAVDCITRDIASQEFFFADANGKIVDMRLVPDNVKAPFESNRAGLSFIQILKFTVPNLLLTGNAYLWVVRGTAWGVYNKIQDSFIPLSSRNVKITLNQNGLNIERYQVTLDDGSQHEVMPDDMIHIRQNSMISPFVGIGNITKMRLIAEGEISATEYINSFLSDSKKMPLLTVVESGSRDSADMARVQDMLKAKYSNRMAYINGEGVSLVQSNLLQKDMEFLGLRQDSRQTQLSVFGVPPVVAGVPENSNKATSDSQFSGYYKSTINPKLRELADDFTSQHIRRYNSNLYLKFRLHPTGDIETVKNQVEAGIITPNRAAELCGEEFDLTDETRNAYYFPASFIPLGYTAPEQPQQAQSNGTPGANLLDPRNVKAICEDFIKSATKPKRFQRRYLEAALRSRNLVEDRFVGKLSEYFKKQEERILQNLRGYDSKSAKADLSELTPELIFDLNIEKGFLEDEIRPLHTSAVQKGISDINTITGAGVNINLSNPFVKAAIAKLGQKITGEVPGNTLKDLSKIIVKSVDESWNINQIQDAIQDKFDGFQGYRARMIARTESRMAWDVGAIVAYKDLGVQTLDVVGCTQFEPDSDCGRQGVPISQADTLTFHPNHIGSLAPSIEPG